MIILGSTGSIGVTALKIAEEFSLNIDVLTAGKNIKKLNEQINIFKPNIVVVSNKEDIHKVNHNKIYHGDDGIIRAIEESSSSVVLNALVGFLGVLPTIKSIELNKTVALANKESLVVAGNLIDMSKIKIIDSEHFALWYMLNNRKVKKMTITASGGAFRDYDINNLHSATIKEALKHPSWSMGDKITIDSATMTNKLFELLEAKWLFGVNNLDALIEISSTIHAIVDFVDGSSIAHIAKPDMKLPISYALLENIKQEIINNCDFDDLKKIEFGEIDSIRYPIWDIKDDLLQNHQMGVVINSANEVSVDAFLQNKISFLDIHNYNIKAYNKFKDVKHSSLDEIININKEVKKFTSNLID